MPETGYETEDDYTDPHDPQEPVQQREDYHVRIERSKVREMEQRAKEAEQLKAERDRLQRELAFARAGIDLGSEDPKVRFFIEGYKGDPDPEAIRAQAEAFGVLDGDQTPAKKAEAEPEDTPLEDGEADLTRERRQLAQAAPPDQAPPGDPYEEAQKVFERAMQDGAQWKEAFGAAFNLVANAANRGDERVILGRRQGLSG
ncbi:MAG UNVERIFIED_CONTAM: hypothetical protein LOD86_11525 [Thermobifida fusca]